MGESTCRYDWQNGFRGLRLHCIVHRHAAGISTVIVQCDTLPDMLARGHLTGAALKDARKGTHGFSETVSRRTAGRQD